MLAFHVFRRETDNEAVFRRDFRQQAIVEFPAGKGLGRDGGGRFAGISVKYHHFELSAPEIPSKFQNASSAECE